MKNLYKLKNKGEPFNGMIVKHDMTKNNREKERSLQKEATEKSLQEETTNFKKEKDASPKYKMGRLTNQSRALRVPELE